MTPYSAEEAEVDARAAATAALPGAALWYASIGLHVFACQSLAKVPLRGSRGFKDATRDAVQIRAWWATEPAANIGLATGHVIDVLDFDGPRAHASWGEHIGGDYAGLEILGTVSTPRPGGLHVWVPAEAGRKNRSGMLPGVDFRARGGYVIAPPSLTDARPGQVAGRYRFLRHPVTEGEP